MPVTIGRRELIAVLGGAAAWSLAAREGRQQRSRSNGYRQGVLSRR